MIRNDRFSFLILPEYMDRELKYESEARTNELFTVSHTIIVKKFASLNSASLGRLLVRVKHHISVE